MQIAPGDKTYRCSKIWFFMLCYEIILYTILYNNDIMSGKNNYNVNLPVMIIYCTLY